jgi:hypothetical protein
LGRDRTGLADNGQHVDIAARRPEPAEYSGAMQIDPDQIRPKVLQNGRKIRNVGGDIRRDTDRHGHTTTLGAAVDPTKAANCTWAGVG